MAPAAVELVTDSREDVTDGVPSRELAKCNQARGCTKYTDRAVVIHCTDRRFGRMKTIVKTMAIEFSSSGPSPSPDRTFRIASHPTAKSGRNVAVNAYNGDCST